MKILLGPKTSTLHLRLTPALKARLEREARQAGLTLTAYILMKLVK